MRLELYFLSRYETLLQLETVYAGMRLDRDGTAVPGLMGRLCQWTSTRPAVTFTSYKDFHNRSAPLSTIISTIIYII